MALIAHFHHQRIQVHDRIQLFQRPVLPQLHFLQDRLGHVGDQCRRHLDAVYLLQVALDLAGRHPARVHRDDLVVEAGPARLPLGHDPGLEGRFAVAGRLQLQLAEVALQGFRAFPVARVAPVVARRVVLLVAQMIAEFGFQRPFQEGFGQLFEQTVLPDDILGLLVVGEQLINQLLVDCHGSPSFFLPWPFTQFYLHPRGFWISASGTILVSVRNFL